MDFAHRFRVLTEQRATLDTPMHTRTKLSNAVQGRTIYHRQTPAMNVSREGMLVRRGQLPATSLRLHPASISSTRLSGYPTKRAPSSLPSSYSQLSAFSPAVLNAPFSFPYFQTRAISNVKPPADSLANVPPIRNADAMGV